MSETAIEIIAVSVFILIVLFGITRMQSPSKGADAMSAVIEETEKILSPKVKELREAKDKTQREGRIRQAGDGDGDGERDGERGGSGA
jgi:hypothetical protein